MSYIDDLMDMMWPAKDFQDRTAEVTDQNKRLKASRQSTAQRHGSMATPMRPTEASQRASETYSNARRTL